MTARPGGIVRRALVAWATASLALGATASIALADPPGNNGTVKVHPVGGPHVEPEVRNVPHLEGCSVELHFFFGDGGQEGDWYIVDWPPTGNVDGDEHAGTYEANDEGEATEIAQLHPQGETHYKLYWKGDEDKHWKHKVFWLTGCGCGCGGEGGGEGGGGSGEGEDGIDEG